MNTLRNRFLRSFFFVLLPFFALTALLVAAPLRLVIKPFRKKINSLWAGTPILTLPLKARAERVLGINAKSLVYHSYGIAEDGFDIHLGRFIRMPVLGKLVRPAVFLYACVTQDRLHFFFDQALLPSYRGGINWYELAVFKLLGIHLFFWVYGGDVRVRKTTQELGKPNCCSFCQEVESACICNTERSQRQYRMVTRYATAVFSMGDMIHYTPGSNNKVFFWPIDLSAQGGKKYKPLYPRKPPGEMVRVVHAANHRHFKGTRFLVEAVDNLRAQGWPIELILVENVPNDQALEIYRGADIIFDQCLIGFHGYFALEAMALGKPVLCFIRFPERYMLHPEECPIVNIRLDTIESVLKSLIEQPEQLREIGRKGRAYIEKYFSLEAVAARLAYAYKQCGVTL